VIYVTQVEIELAEVRGELAKIREQIKGIGSTISSLGIGIFVFYLLSYSWTDSLWYSVRYGVEFRDVQMERPHDCDFMRAPLGDKGCSYKSHVQVFNAEGELVAGENAPKYGSDTKTGKAHRFLRRRQELGLV
jgi:hypothetical protein